MEENKKKENFLGKFQKEIVIGENSRKINGKVLKKNTGKLAENFQLKKW